MLNIAITGGIGSGKSQAAEYIRSLGYTVIDADAVSRAITGRGGKALPLIRERFGDSLFNEDGSLNRAAVRDMIYNDSEKKALYEACTTKLVLEDLDTIREMYKGSEVKAVFYDIPLLFETETECDYDAVWVIAADKEIRKKRVIERSNLDEDTIELIMQRQAPESEKIAKADYVIYTNGTIEELQNAVNEALKNFLK